MREAAGPRSVAFVVRRLTLGGGERVLVEQVRALAPYGAPVDVWVVDDDGLETMAREVRAANPAVRDVGVVPSATALALRLLSRRHDVVFTQTVRRGYRAVLARRRVPLGRPPVVVETVHERYRWHLLDHGGIRRRAVDFWLLTHDVRGALEAALGVPAERTAVARPLFPSSLLVLDDASRAESRALRAAWGAGAGAVVVGYLGRLDANKGLVPLVGIARRLIGEGLDLHLVLAGRPATGRGTFAAALVDAVEAARREDPRCRDRIRLVGPLPSRRAAFGAFDVTALLSRTEGLLPLMLVESLSAGVPVVTTDVGGIGTCLSDGVDAAVVRKVPDDEADPTEAVVADFEARLRRFVGDAAERRRLGVAGRARVEALVAGNDFHGDVRRAVERALLARAR